MSLPKSGDVAYIVATIDYVVNPKEELYGRPCVRVCTHEGDKEDSFLIYCDQIRLVEPPEEAT